MGIFPLHSPLAFTLKVIICAFRELSWQGNERKVSGYISLQRKNYNIVKIVF